MSKMGVLSVSQMAKALSVFWTVNRALATPYINKIHAIAGVHSTAMAM